MEIRTVAQLNNSIIECRKCPRLVAWREKTATEKVRRFQDEPYWGKPVPGFGDPAAQLLIVGLAPAAHGANRTGRMFTGDRSGDWLYRALHKYGFASQAHSSQRDDGLTLSGAYITAAVRCAPPQNKPTSDERKACFPYLLQEAGLLSNLSVVIALGKLAFDTSVKIWPPAEKSGTRFAHLAEVKLADSIHLVASYHPSQQNTFTGRLTEPMFNAVFARAKELIQC